MKTNPYLSAVRVWQKGAGQYRLHSAIFYAGLDHPLEMHNLALAQLCAARIEHAVGLLSGVVAYARRALTTR